MTIATPHELNRLQKLYAAGFQNTFLDTAVHKIIARQIARDEADLQRINTDLARYETQYNMESAHFWAQYQAGQLADTADFMEWHVLCKMQQRIQNRLDILRGDISHARD